MEWIHLIVTDNRRYNVSSLVLIDVCAPYLINRQLPIMDLLANSRSMWLTVMSLHVPDPCAVRATSCARTWPPCYSSSR